ncbi:MAG: selenophosphate synthase [Dehalococcoidia bacterium DG_18]|nr:MAG: selenophosphate synthase [Dehalococcoidia bacterium DG_18]
MPLVDDPNLLVGLERGDDAGVYKLNDDLAIIQTIDFITPIVDDPYTFGQIAAANALSDVYAMGGKPLTAMNVVCFPIQNQDISVLGEIMRGGWEKLREAEVALVGGHSIEDPELKYGLSVTGVVHPAKMVTKEGAKTGDKLILTKPLGTGIVSTAIKGGVAGEEAVAQIAASMTTLNKLASELMQEAGVHACTDITGFGLLGHACGMIEDSPVGIEIHIAAIPFFPEAKGFARMGLVPGGTQRNREFRLNMIEQAYEIGDDIWNILFDPQTSGGLLISIPGHRGEEFLQNLHRNGIKDAAIIGEVVGEPKGRIIIRE